MKSKNARDDLGVSCSRVILEQLAKSMIKKRRRKRYAGI